MLMLLRLLLIFLPILLSCFGSYSRALCKQVDHDSLLCLALNISPTLPLNWTSSDCCGWEGISCDPTGRVTHLWLPRRGLTGAGISPCIGNITNLSHLNLSHNRLAGALPSGLFASLRRLAVLDLSFNSFSGLLPLPLMSSYVDLSSNRFNGAVPSSFLSTTWNLAHFNVSINSLSGTIPCLCRNSRVRSVRILDFSDNRFSGHIPSDIGKCSQLQVFRAGFNNLSGLLPEDLFFGATALEEFSIPANSISGTISDNITHLSNLSRLELFGNNLTGSIPRGIGKLFQLEHLLLHINSLTGTLPPSLMNCTSLRTLNLRVNFMTGDVSTFNFGTLLELSILDLGNNNFSGSLPESLYSCTSLTSLRLASNQLEGEISSGILGLESLNFLSLSNNRLSNITSAIGILMKSESLSTVVISKNFFREELPDGEITSVQKIQVLGLGGCLLSGPLPAWLAKLQNMQVLDLSQNRITGSVPDWMGSLSKLFYLDLSDNLISGTFPKELCMLKALGSNSKEANDTTDWSHLELPVFVAPNLQYNQLMNLPPAIYLRNNYLSGEIPAEIGRLKSLHVLELNRNNFSGTIPDQMSNLTNLEKLDLSENRLTGKIPPSLKALNFLSWFSVAYNNLQGAVPEGGQFHTFPPDSFKGNPLLCDSVSGESCNSVLDTPAPPPDDEDDISDHLLSGVIAGTCFGLVNGFVTGLLAWPTVKLKFGLLVR